MGVPLGRARRSLQPDRKLSVNRSTSILWHPWRHRQEETPMAKKGRKRRARKKSAANHGKRPNA
jgi:hypothetical protein